MKNASIFTVFPQIAMGDHPKRAIIRRRQLFQIFHTGGHVLDKELQAIKERVKYMNITIEKPVIKTGAFVKILL